MKSLAIFPTLYGYGKFELELRAINTKKLTEKENIERLLKYAEWLTENSKPEKPTDKDSTS